MTLRASAAVLVVCALVGVGLLVALVETRRAVSITEQQAVAVRAIGLLSAEIAALGGQGLTAKRSVEDARLAEAFLVLGAESGIKPGVVARENLVRLLDRARHPFAARHAAARLSVAIADRLDPADPAQRDIASSPRAINAGARLAVFLRAAGIAPALTGKTRATIEEALAAVRAFPVGAVFAENADAIVDKLVGGDEVAPAAIEAAYNAFATEALRAGRVARVNVQQALTARQSDLTLTLWAIIAGLGIAALAVLVAGTRMLSAAFAQRPSMAAS